jgi:hypothetical protein
MLEQQAMSVVAAALRGGHGGPPWHCVMRRRSLNTLPMLSCKACTWALHRSMRRCFVLVSQLPPHQDWVTSQRAGCSQRRNDTLHIVKRFLSYQRKWSLPSPRPRRRHPQRTGLLGWRIHYAFTHCIETTSCHLCRCNDKPSMRLRPQTLPSRAVPMWKQQQLERVRSCCCRKRLRYFLLKERGTQHFQCPTTAVRAYVLSKMRPKHHHHHLGLVGCAVSNTPIAH